MENPVNKPGDEYEACLRLADQLDFTQVTDLWARTNLRLLAQIEGLPQTRRAYGHVLHVARRVVPFLDYKGPRRDEVRAAGRRFFDLLSPDLLLDAFSQERVGILRRMRKEGASEIPDAIDQAIRNAQEFPILNELGQMHYGVALKCGDETAREKLIGSCYELLAKRTFLYVQRGGDIGHLWGSGHTGLIRATVSWNPARGKKFSSWAAWYIDTAIKREGCRRQRMIDLPPGAQKQIACYVNQIYRINEFGARDPDCPTLDPDSDAVPSETIATMIGWPVDEVREARRLLLLANPESLDRPLESEGGEGDRYDLVQVEAQAAPQELPAEVAEGVNEILRQTALNMFLSSGWASIDKLVRDVRILKAVLMRKPASPWAPLCNRFGMSRQAILFIVDDVLVLAREAVQHMGIEARDFVDAFPGMRDSEADLPNDRVRRLVETAQRARRGLNLLARQAKLSSGHIGLEMLLGLPEEDWRILRHYYGLGVPSTQDTGEMKSRWRRQGFDFDPALDIAHRRHVVVNRLRLLRTGREMMLADMRKLAAQRGAPFTLGIEDLPDGIVGELPGALADNIRNELRGHYGLGTHRDPSTQRTPVGRREAENRRGRRLTILVRLCRLYSTGGDAEAHIMAFAARFAGCPAMREGRDYLAYDLRKTRGEITDALLNALPPKQRVAVHGWYGLGRAPMPTEALLKRLNSPAYRGPRGKGNMSEKYLSELLVKARAAMRTYPDGWAVLAEGVGLPISDLRVCFCGMSENLQSVMRATYGLDEPRLESRAAVAERAGVAVGSVVSIRSRARRYLMRATG